MSKILLSTTALMWGFQFSFLNPVLALLLTQTHGASPAQVGLALAGYNASGFVASLLIPSWADRRRDYVGPLVGCTALSVAFALALFFAGSFEWALAALVLLGGPAGVGMSLFFAQLRHAGTSTDAVMQIRAVVSFAWVAGPPIVTLLLGAFGAGSVPLALGAVAVLALACVLLMHRTAGPITTAAQVSDTQAPVRLTVLVVIFAAFVALQTTNAAAVAMMGLFVTERAGLDVWWVGIILGVAAAAEIPALLYLGRLTTRFGTPALLASGCGAGIVYYAVMAVATAPAVLVAAQLLNAWFIAALLGLGMTLFQDLVPRPGLATGLYLNTRRVGAIAAAPVLAVGGTSWGFEGAFAVCAVLTVLGLGLVEVARRLEAAAARTAAVQPDCAAGAAKGCAARDCAR